VLVPVSGVSIDVTDERLDGVEGAPANGLAREDSEPGLDHVQPGRALWGEVELDAGVLLKPLQDGGHSVSARVVEDDVELLARIASGQTLEEDEEVVAVVGGAAFTDDLSAGDLECGEEARDSGAAVVMSLTRGQPGSHRQQWLSSLQGLDLGLLVEAEHDGVCRRIQIEADDIMDSLFRVRIGDELELLELVGLEIVGFPDAMDGHVGDARAAGHLPGCPLSEASLWLLERQGDDLCSLSGFERGGTSGAGLVVDSGDTLSPHPAADSTHLDRGIPALSSDLGTWDSVHHQQDASCSPAQTSGCRRGTDELLQLPAVLVSQSERVGLPAHGT